MQIIRTGVTAVLGVLMFVFGLASLYWVYAVVTTGGSESVTNLLIAAFVTLLCYGIAVVIRPENPLGKNPTE